MTDEHLSLRGEEVEQLRRESAVRRARPVPPPLPPDGCHLIVRERTRQIAEEGWTLEHDDEHRRGELAQAALAYLYAGKVAQSAPSMAVWFGNPRTGALEGPASPAVHWPWELATWKPSDDPVRNLVRAGALIAAEIDRLQRLAPASGEEGQG